MMKLTDISRYNFEKQRFLGIDILFFSSKSWTDMKGKRGCEKLQYTKS
jgi:hypothetical protein